MNEVISFDVPSQIKDLGNLNVIADELKKMKGIYDEHCQSEFISEAKDRDPNFDSILKPNKRKRATDVPHITFT